MKTSAILIIGIFLCGCTNLSDKKHEQPWLSTIDINEAYFVKDSLNQDQQLKDTFDVEAGITTTTVRFKCPPRPANELMTRTYMRELKAILTKHRGRTANTIRFVFPEVTLEE